MTSATPPQGRPHEQDHDGVQLGFDAMYSAITGRDTRFDGTFYTAVRTTGVYCRPSCPARKPLPHNVTFYPSAAAAQAAGYRACRRCVPEALPGSPWWNIPGSVAARAVQLIDQGVVDEEGVTGLANRLGWSARTVTRLMVEQTGATPIAHARARRARLAHALITSTDRPFTEIAYAAGFASIRQFNDTILAVYGINPTRLRAVYGAGARATETATVPGLLRAHLAYRPPFDWIGLLAWYAGRALPVHETVTLDTDQADDGTSSIASIAEGTYTVALQLPHGPAIATVTHQPEHSRLRADLSLTDLRDYGPACAALRRLLDLDADPHAIDSHLRGQPILAPLVHGRPGLRIPGTPTPLEALLRAVTGQQVSVAAGRAQLQALSSSTCPSAPDRAPDSYATAVTRPFPTAAQILRTDLHAYRGPSARRKTLIDALRLADAGGLDPGRDLTDIAHDLAQIHGVGPWTIAYTLMRGYGHPDVDLSGDRALAVACRHLGDPSPATVLRNATPWRSYAALHLWLSSTLTDHDQPQAAARDARDGVGE